MTSQAKAERPSSSLVQRALRVGGVLVACATIMNIAAIVNTTEVPTRGDASLKLYSQTDPEPSQRLRHEQLSEQSSTQVMSAVDPANVSKGLTDQSSTKVTVAAVDPVNASEEGEELPPIKIHYTSKTRAPSTESEWRKTNGADVEIHFYNDEDSEALVREWRPQFLPTYQTQLSPVERADYFRYLVLWAHGGVYVDSDISFITPVDKWLSTFGWDISSDGGKRHLQSLDAVVGVEFPSPQTHYKRTGWLPLQFTQFVIAGKKYSQALWRVVLHVEKCVASVDRGGDVEMTIERTGPAAFTRAILDIIQTEGIVAPHVREMHEKYALASNTQYPRALLPIGELEKTGQVISWRHPRPEDGTMTMGDDRAVGSILVLPYRAFGYHQYHHIANAAVLTRHWFHNSWRSDK